MPQLKPEAALRKKLESLERHKAMLDTMGFSSRLTRRPLLSVPSISYT